MFVDFWNSLRYYITKVLSESNSVGVDNMDTTAEQTTTTYDIRINELQRKLYEQALREYTNRHMGTSVLEGTLEFQAYDLLQLTSNRNTRAKLKANGINDFTN